MFRSNAKKKDDEEEEEEVEVYDGRAGREHLKRKRDFEAATRTVKFRRGAEVAPDERIAQVDAMIAHPDETLQQDQEQMLRSKTARHVTVSVAGVFEND